MQSLRIGFDVAQTCQQKAGCGRYAESLAIALSKQLPSDWQLFLYHHFGEWINASTANGTFIEEHSNVSSPLAGLDPSSAAALWQDVAKGKQHLPGTPHIIHSNCFQAPLVPSAKLVYTIYDVSFWVHPEFTTEANRVVCQAGTLRALELADGFVFISENSKREFESIFPGWLSYSRKPHAVTHLGHFESDAECSVRDRKSLSSNSFSRDFWLAVGSLEPRKNYETLLDAMELYWQQSSDPCPLLIAGGEGWKSDILKQQIQGLEERGLVRLLGYISDSDLEDLYSKARALVFPSWYEGFGLPILEAMSHSCPVISSDRASLPEIGGSAVKYIEPGSAESISNAMLQLESDSNFRNALIAAGKEQSMKFSFQQTAIQTLQFYREIMG